MALFVSSMKLKKNAPELVFENIESLSTPEDQKVLYCRCSKAIIFANKDCLSSNNGNICAQGPSGGNINCRQYDSNCGSNE